MNTDWRWCWRQSWILQIQFVRFPIMFVKRIRKKDLLATNSGKKYSKVQQKLANQLIYNLGLIIRRKEIVMQSIEFKKPKEKWSQSIEDDEKEFVRIATVLIKSLGWKLTEQIDIDVILWTFQKKNIEIFLVYNEMDGTYLRTHDENFPLESLFGEINDILNKEL